MGGRVGGQGGGLGVCEWMGGIGGEGVEVAGLEGALRCVRVEQMRRSCEWRHPPNHTDGE